MVRLTQLAAATKVTPSESVERVRNAEGTGRGRRLEQVAARNS
jgi:hypothetical protein